MLGALSRRTVLGGGCSCGLSLALGDAHAKGESAGCYRSGAAYEAEVAPTGVSFGYAGGSSSPKGSGDALLDQALAVSLASMSKVFGVLPSFEFFTESGGPNAFASNEVKSRPDGSVAYGRKLLAAQRKDPATLAAQLVAVCAHEFGHIVQYKRGAQLRLIGQDRRVRRLELHADYLAGYFAGLRKQERSDFPAAEIARTQFFYGDSAFDSPDHHGTQKERGQAVVLGFKAAYESRMTFDEAFRSGEAFFRTA